MRSLTGFSFTRFDLGTVRAIPTEANSRSTMMKFTTEELLAQQAEVQERYNQVKKQGLSLDITRGKPCAEQLDLSSELLTLPGNTDYKTGAGVDCRNYGGLDGIPEAKQLFADYLDVAPRDVIIGGNASLTMMHDALVRALLFGAPGGDRPWKDLDSIKFLCPSPGFDRHFAVTEHLGFELIAIDMKDDGPDMGQVEALVAEDPAIKGIWCVPKYSNPTGAIYSDAVVDRLAGMQAAAADFRIIWDNAYGEHPLAGPPDPVKSILRACREAGNPNRVLLFASTSKISHAGSGISAMAAGEDNIADIKKHLSVQTIGPDKVNQLRHMRFFRNYTGLRVHMQRHAQILKPKFDLVQDILKSELDGTGRAQWTNPKGGYFVSLNTQDGCARDSINLSAQAGVKFTQAGATFPYGVDPRDRNIRIAPTFLSLKDIKPAIEALAISIQLATIQKLLSAS